VKERLTGAIILVALIVLLVPELLTGPVRSAPRAAVVAPSPEEPPLRSYTINLSDDAHTRSVALPASEPEPPAPLATAPPATPPAPSTPAAQTPSPQPAAHSASTAKSPPQPAAAAPPLQSRSVAAGRTGAAPMAQASAGGAWVVQLGSFASRANAEHLAQEMRARGFPVSVSQGASGRRLYRVRVGPVPDRAAASELAGKLRLAGHSGSVVPR
jgi:cell division septation protein DedD